MSNSLSKIEKRTAYALTLPAVLIVFAIVLFPIFSNVWISFKEVQLKDIRIPEPRAKKIVKSIKNEDTKIKIIYKLRNSSLIQDIRNVKFHDKFPSNVKPIDLDERCKFTSNKVQCDFGNWSKKYREQFVIFFETKNGEKIDKKQFKLNKPNLKGKADNILLTSDFTLSNFKKVITNYEFKNLLLTTFYYTFFGTVGAIVFGILSAQMVNQKFRGRSFVRSTLLFPYVAPVVALAFTWELLLDPNSGTLNNLLLNYNIIDKPINLLGQKYVSIFIFGFEFKLRLALTTVIIFEIWRYFPLAFLFILARLQAVPKELYEAADIDGAGPYTKFMNITLPQITAVISILFMIRFIWNFNKFEDIFLLTGGASGTRTLPINVYEQGFSIGNIGMGSAVSIVIVILLLFFMLIYFKLIGKRANES
ncbi:carbohydrate ABC transporter permease [Candidatus Pelagibacter communis]|uniref:carbohydrate ABC transporter permease n=1 Tax=Pelagibacter ubique TaxID=198252 RepID=UPI00065B3A26|nr:sugar ABC transporter permease [Candidatus Pelagibacter ubique]